MTEAEQALTALLSLMERLRDPQRGCPWDVEQTFATIAPYTIEEAYEVADAIDKGDPTQLRDELGDLLFQVVFHARMAQEREWFDFAAVARSIHDKLVRRHPHVFGSVGSPGSATAVLGVWEELKAAERAEAKASGRTDDGSILADVPKSLPALLRATKLSRRAGRVGFDWPDAAGVREKVLEELREVEEAVADQARAASKVDGAGAGGAVGAADGVGAGGTTGRGAEAPAPSPEVFEELGDLLFAVASWARHLNVNPEEALRAANAKFERRFRAMEGYAKARQLPLKGQSLEALEGLWREAKVQERAAKAAGVAGVKFSLSNPESLAGEKSQS